MDFRPSRSRAGCVVLVLVTATVACVDEDHLDLSQLGDERGRFKSYDLTLTQELVNDAPLGPGVPQPSQHCPTGPGSWFAGSGRSTASSNVFGDLTQVEVYCVNRDLSQLSGGMATWTDGNGDTIEMTFVAQLVQGEVYEPAPNAPIAGVALFSGGSGRWAELTGAAFIVGTQNGDGTATLRYQGTVYIPAD